MKTRLLLLFALLLIGLQPLAAQEAPEVDHSYKPLTLKLNEDGSKYVRFIMWHQLWATTNNLAPESPHPTHSPAEQHRMTTSNTSGALPSPSSSPESLPHSK